jgi:hypothetical protein
MGALAPALVGEDVEDRVVAPAVTESASLTRRIGVRAGGGVRQ